MVNRTNLLMTTSRFSFDSFGLIFPLSQLFVGLGSWRGLLRFQCLGSSYNQELLNSLNP